MNHNIACKVMFIQDSWKMNQGKVMQLSCLDQHRMTHGLNPDVEIANWIFHNPVTFTEF